MWACLHFPCLALEVLQADAAAPRPIAVIDGPVQQRRIAHANAPARASGVRVGHAPAAAQALCPHLVLHARDEAAERRVLELLAAWAYRFSADVSLAPPDALLVEVGRSLNLFDGWPALERRLRSELAALGYAHAIAAAPNATAAQVLAHVRDGLAIVTSESLAHALDSLPLAAVGFDAKVVVSLSGMGFRQLRDLFRLPRAGLARRIGPAALDHLDRLRGHAAERLPRYRPPDRFERRVEFGHGVESTTALLFPLRRLLRDLALFLTARDGGVQRFRLVLGHERGATTRLDVGLLAPERAADVLLELTRARMERVELPAPAHALTLVADELPPLCPLHRDLFDTTRSEALAWPALYERLRARLGDAAVRGFACVEDHRPERAWRSVEPKSERPARSDVPHLHRPLRPLWLLPRPLPMRPPPAEILAGPERIESGWWDGGDQRRDYYVVKTRSGQRAWAFVETGAQNWMLHGWFA